MFRKPKLHKIAGLMIAGFCFAATQAYAATTQSGSPLPLQQALAGHDSNDIYSGKSDKGNFAVSSSFFSGRASGVDPLTMNSLGGNGDYKYDKTAELEGDQRVYALLIDGSYDFNYDFGTNLPIHPYLAGGMGMAMYGQPGNNPNLSLQSGDMAPLFRVGGGVTYHLGEAWNLSLDYKEGFSTGVTTSDQIFTGRGNQAVDMHVLNMGMHYTF